MIKFKIKIPHIFSELLDVEAENEAGALKLAKEILKTPNREFYPVHEVVLPPDNWTMVTQDQFMEIMQQLKNNKIAKDNSGNKESEIVK